MMPFRLEDVRGTLPDNLSRWREPLATLCSMSIVREGIAYLTIDEALVREGETHRRPGLHVDGIGPDGSAGGWGGGGGYGSSGMLTSSSHVGCVACVAWDQYFDGWPLPDGDCSNLRDQTENLMKVIMEPGIVYHFGPLTVHESTPVREDTRRQFVRVSMPSNAPWYEGYTKNSLGVLPTGPVHAKREKQMGYRP